MNNVLSVIQLNTYIKRKFEQDYVLKDVSVEGELSNFKRHSSGHLYFTLKDDKAGVSCVMFRTYTGEETRGLRDGDKVIIKGSVSLYEKTGQYQVYVRSIEKAGLGDLYVLFEKLKKQLAEEGLFDESRKKPLPKYANRIGIITSSTGAAIRDIVQVAKRRNPYVELILYPSLVQGAGAKDNIVRGIKYFNDLDDIDLLIVGRGGGSIEDLWPFNEEVVARAIGASDIPVISAVGHETDFTISDFVSDMRAPTPSAAAELAVYDYGEFQQRMYQYKQVLYQGIEYRLQLKKQELQGLRRHIELKHPRRQLEDQMMHLDQLRLLMYSRGNALFDAKRSRLNILRERLQGKSPLQRLEDGYAYISKGDQRVRSVDDVEVGESLNIYVADGKLETQVSGKESL